MTAVRPTIAIDQASLSIWFSEFWSRHGDQVLVGVLITVGGACAIWLLIRVWRALMYLAGAILRLLYWTLVGWWASKLKRWIFG